MSEWKGHAIERSGSRQVRRKRSIRVEAMMDAQGVWEAVEPAAGAAVDVKKDKMARAHLLQALPEDR